MSKGQDSYSALGKALSAHPVLGGDNKWVSDRELPWDSDVYGGYVASERYDEFSEVFDYESDGEETPVLYVPGNTGTDDHADEIAEKFLEEGYDPDKVFSIDPGQTTPDIGEHVEQLDDFVSEMQDYTGDDEFSIIAHSYGAPAAWKAVHENNWYDDLDNFVSIAGALKGTAVADVGNMTGLSYVSPDFITRRSAEEGELKELRDESRLTEEADVLTLSSEDDFYFKPLSDSVPSLKLNPLMALNPRCYEDNRESPKLDGAENVVFENLGHNELRKHPEAVEEIYGFFSEN